MTDEAARAGVHVSQAKCPFCHDAIPRGEEPAVCPGCHAMHHAGCLAEHGACATCGAEHPRFGARPRKGAQRIAGRVVTAVMALTAVGGLLGAAISAFATTVNTDQLFGLFVSVAAVLALLAGRTGALRGRGGPVLALFVAALGALLLAGVALNDHLRAGHFVACVAWGASLLGLGGLGLGLYLMVFDVASAKAAAGLLPGSGAKRGSGMSAPRKADA